MNKLRPKKHDTIVLEGGYEWAPSSFDNFLIELDHIKKQISEAIIYRGQRNKNWFLDSTFARSLKKIHHMEITDLYPDYLIHDVEHQHRYATLYLNKMNHVLINPALQEFEKQGCDPWFEFHRHCQQNSKDPNFIDIVPFGTCFIDFTYNWKVALFFSNLNSNENEEKALYVVRQTVVGRVLQRKLLFKNILQTLTDSLKFDKLYGHLPLFIHPEKQINNLLDPKPKRQEAIYFAQMDFRMTLEFSWHLLAQKTGKQVFIKLILPKNTKNEIDMFLQREGMTYDYLFPKTIFDGKRKVK